MRFSRRHFLSLGAASAAVALRVRASTAADAAAAETSPISNAWGKAQTTKVDAEHVTIFRGREGQAYNHQVQLTSQAGKLFATWSLGIRDEEAPGQRMVLSISDDAGRSWSEPIRVADAHPGKFANSVVISSGLRAEQGKLIAFYGEWERSQDGVKPDGSRKWMSDQGKLFNSRTEQRTSADGGHTWSEPTVLFPNVVNYFPPATTKTGRWIFPGNLAYPLTDDPAGLSGWRRVAVPGIPADYVDNYFNMNIGNRLAHLSQLYTEANFYQTDDGVIHMMLRNERQGRLGVTESRDNGETWSTPALTDYTDTICRAQFGRLPDSRYFGMNCPASGKGNAPGTQHGLRTPAVLALSRDGVTFDRHFILGDEKEHPPRMAGMAKHGRYGYPYLHVAGDMAWMIYSRAKEDICIARFPLSALG